jgi:hypothetical protein
MFALMLVPNRILGGILATTLGMLPGLAVLAESSVPPGDSVTMTIPATADLASLRTAAPLVSSASAPELSLRPVHRPASLAISMTAPALRPMARDDVIPVARWDGNGGTPLWSRATLRAINGQRHDLSDIVPRDIAEWCPAYTDNPERLRDAFWVGVISALVRYESRFDPHVVGGGGLYHGLLQILPSTARHFGCSATTGQALSDPEENLACGVRIMSATVRRDEAVAFYDGRWRGIAADWGPMTNSDMRNEMIAWTREQTYCTRPTGVTLSPRPPARPWTLMTLHEEAPVTEAIQLAMLSTEIRDLRAIP